MKTDKFAETLRKKIESIQPVFHEEDWERFTAFAGTQTIPFWKSFWGKTTLYSVGTTAFVGLIAYNITQHYAQKSLHKTIETLHTQIDSLQRLPKESQLLTTTAAAPDTVYITRYLSKDLAEKQSGEEQIAQLENEVLASNSAVSENSTEPFDTPSDNPTPITNKSEEHSPKNEQPTDISLSESVYDERSESSKKNTIWKTKNNRQKQKAVGYKTGTAVATKQYQPNHNEKNAVTWLANTSATVPVPSATAPKDMPATAQTLVVEPLSILGIDTAANRAKTAMPHVPLQQQVAYYEPPKPPKPPFVWPTVKARAGLGVGASAGNLSPNFTAEVFVGNRFSISSGLAIKYFATQKYFTDEQFSKQNKRDFRTVYAPKAPPTFEIFNITERVYVVQVPIRLSYYQPLKHNFWLLGSVGTSLDVYGSKRVTFDLRQTRSEFEQSINIAKLPVVPFNNLVFSAGIEKRVGRFSFQFAPYWTTQTTAIAYRPTNGGLGGRLNVLVRF
jgi:hypothetical protein